MSEIEAIEGEKSSVLLSNWERYQISITVDGPAGREEDVSNLKLLSTLHQSEKSNLQLTVEEEESHRQSCKKFTLTLNSQSSEEVDPGNT